MIVPAALQKGDKVAFVASARKISAQELEPAIKLLENWGLSYEFAPGLFNEFNQFAGNHKERSRSLQWALDNPEIKAVWFARGGYGTVRIIDDVDFTVFRNHPKWLLGYSDITVLHSHLMKNEGICSIHGTMPINVPGNSEAALESTRMALFGEQLVYELAEHPLNRFGSIDGKLIGGNLSVLYSIMGSQSDMPAEGNVLFLEDLDEYLYHVDRMMTALKRAGKLRHLQGLLIGGMSDMRDNQVPFGSSAEQIIREIVEEYDYPVYFNIPSGHISDNRALIMGARVSVAAGVMSFG